MTRKDGQPQPLVSHPVLMMTPLGPGFGCGQLVAGEVCGEKLPPVPKCIDQYYKCMTCYKMERGLL